MGYEPPTVILERRPPSTICKKEERATTNDGICSLLMKPGKMQLLQITFQDSLKVFERDSWKGSSRHEFALDPRIRGDRWSSSFSVWTLSVCSILFLQTDQDYKNISFTILTYPTSISISRGFSNHLGHENSSILPLDTKLIWVKTSQDQPQFTMGSHAKSMGIPQIIYFSIGFSMIKSSYWGTYI